MSLESSGLTILELVLISLLMVILALAVLLYILSKSLFLYSDNIAQLIFCFSLLMGYVVISLSQTGMPCIVLMFLLQLFYLTAFMASFIESLIILHKDCFKIIRDGKGGVIVPGSIYTGITAPFIYKHIQPISHLHRTCWFNVIAWVWWVVYLPCILLSLSTVFCILASFCASKESGTRPMSGSVFSRAKTMRKTRYSVLIQTILLTCSCAAGVLHVYFQSKALLIVYLAISFSLGCITLGTRCLMDTQVMERMKRGYTNWENAGQTYETVLDPVKANYNSPRRKSILKKKTSSSMDLIDADDDNMTSTLSRKTTLDSRRSVVSISETIDEIGELEESHPVTDHPINKLKMDLIGQSVMQMTTQMDLVGQVESVSTENLHTYTPPDIVRIQNGSSKLIANRDHSGLSNDYPDIYSYPTTTLSTFKSNKHQTAGRKAIMNGSTAGSGTPSIISSPSPNKYKQNQNSLEFPSPTTSSISPLYQEVFPPDQSSDTPEFSGSPRPNTAPSRPHNSGDGDRQFSRTATSQTYEGPVDGQIYRQVYRSYSRDTATWISLPHTPDDANSPTHVSMQH